MAGEMEVAKGMLRTLIKVTFGYPAIFDEVRQECQINNAHVVAGCGSGYLNMSFKCSGEFNIIYIMRTNLVEAQC